MKLRATARSEPIQHKVNITDLNHSSTGFYASLIVLTISTGPTIPSVRALPHPAAPVLGGLDRLAINARGTGGGLAPRCHTRAFAQGLDYFGPCPVVAPLGKVVIDRALGQHIMRQHVPLAPAPVEIENRIEDFRHVDLTRASSARARR